MNRLVVRYTRKDFRVDTFASGGPGGQHQNKTKSGVRITHLPSGLVAESRQHRSQRQNKQAAFQRLAAQVVAWVVEQGKAKHEISREVIRTYHEPDNRVKDHASGFQQSYDEVMDDIARMVLARASVHRPEERD